MKKNISTTKLREFGLTLSLFFPLIIGFLIPYFYRHNFREWTLWVSLFFLIFSFCKPNFLYFPYQAWIKLGNILGYVNSKIIFGFIFYFVVTPLGMVMKFFNYDPLKIKSTKKNDSYKVLNNKDKVDLNRIF